MLIRDATALVDEYLSLVMDRLGDCCDEGNIIACLSVTTCVEISEAPEACRWEDCTTPNSLSGTLYYINVGEQSGTYGAHSL